MQVGNRWSANSGDKIVRTDFGDKSLLLWPRAGRKPSEHKNWEEVSGLHV